MSLWTSLLALLGTNIVERPLELPPKAAFYGVVNHFWYQASDKQIDQYVKALHDNGWFGTIIELRGPFAQFGGSNPYTFDVMLKKADRLARTCEKYGMWLWVIDENYNSPYVRRSLNDQKEDARKVISTLGGYKRIILQGASEVISTKVDNGAHMSKGLELMEFYANAWKVPQVWWVGNTPMALSTPGWAEIADWHISSIGAGGRVPKKINTLNTDHSTILAAMLGGSKEGQKWDLPDVDTLWSRAKTEQKWMVLYHFWGKQPDYDCIKHGIRMWGKNGSWR